MSELGEYYQEKRLNEQIERAKKQKLNVDIVLVMATELLFEVKFNTPHHISLFHPTRGRLDYYPSTGKGIWLKQSKHTFIIKDIESYLIENFK